MSRSRSTIITRSHRPPPPSNDPATYGGVAVAGGKPKFNDVLINGGVISSPGPASAPMRAMPRASPCPISAASPARSTSRRQDIDTFLDIAADRLEQSRDRRRGEARPARRLGHLFLVVERQGPVADRQSRRHLRRPAPAGRDPGARGQSGRQAADRRACASRRAMPISTGATTASTVPDGKVDTDLDGTNISPDRLNLRPIMPAGRSRRCADPILSCRAASRARAIDDANRDPRNDFGGYTSPTPSCAIRPGRRADAQRVRTSSTSNISTIAATRGCRPTISAISPGAAAFTLGWDYRF
jgi:iron complex outermembrane receptor protein